MKSTKKTDEKTWRLFYSLWDEKEERGNPIVVKIVKFQADTHKDMLKRALKILKRSAKKVRRPQSSYCVIIFPPIPQGEKAGDDREVFGLKDKYSDTQKILKLKEKNVQKYFVQGCGPEAFERL